MPFTKARALSDGAEDPKKIKENIFFLNDEGLF